MVSNVGIISIVSSVQYCKTELCETKIVIKKRNQLINWTKLWWPTVAIESEKSKSKVDFVNNKVKSLSGKILNLS